MKRIYETKKNKVFQTEGKGLGDKSAVSALMAIEHAPMRSGNILLSLQSDKLRSEVSHVYGERLCASD